jgi:hypothetical protein
MLTRKIQDYGIAVLMVIAMIALRASRSITSICAASAPASLRS